MTRPIRTRKITETHCLKGARVTKSRLERCKLVRFFSLLWLLVSIAGAADYRAGLARIDITPPAGHAMGGYSDRKGGATGTHDPLYATVLVIESGETQLALVTCDLRSFVSTRVGELAKQKFGIGRTILSVSHTHSGPLTWEARTPWYAEAEDKMVRAIGEAKAAMFPAALSVSTGRIYLGHNRRKVADGRATMWWRNAEKLPSRPLDPTVNVLEVKDAAGKTRALLVNYACHPSVLGPDNLQYSADYPGAMKRYVEAQVPGATCLFVQGGAGNINPYRDKEPVAGQGFQAVEEMGQQLGKTVVSIAGRGRPVTGALRMTSEVMEVANRWKPTEKIPIGWTAGAFGDSLCFAALPGEPFVEHQITFREKSECRDAMMFGYSYSVGGGWAGYLPTVQAAVEGGYGADYNTTVAVGTGERLVDRAVVKIFEMRGLLKELPDAGY
jgi:neutral/alkaline ceramidase-like enzyme